jgi:hypothetical protein
MHKIIWDFNFSFVLNFLSLENYLHCRDSTSSENLKVEILFSFVLTKLNETKTFLFLLIPEKVKLLSRKSQTTFQC